MTNIHALQPFINNVIAQHLRREFHLNSEFFKKELVDKVDAYVENLFSLIKQIARKDIKSDRLFKTTFPSVLSCQSLNKYITELFRLKYNVEFFTIENRASSNFFPLLHNTHYTNILVYSVEAVWKHDNLHVFASSHPVYLYTPVDHLKEIIKKSFPDDVVFMVDGMKIAANRTLVSGFSGNLKAMFESGMKEKNQREITIQEDSASFSQMIEFMKTGEIPQTVKTNEEKLVLYGLAKTYLVTPLEQLLLNTLLPWVDGAEVNSENFVDMFQIGFIYDFTGLTKKCLLLAEADDHCLMLLKSKIDRRHLPVCLELAFELKISKVHAAILESLKRP